MQVTILGACKKTQNAPEFLFGTDVVILTALVAEGENLGYNLPLEALGLFVREVERLDNEDFRLRSHGDTRGTLNGKLATGWQKKRRPIVV